MIQKEKREIISILNSIKMEIRLPKCMGCSLSSACREIYGTKHIYVKRRKSSQYFSFHF